MILLENINKAFLGSRDQLKPKFSNTVSRFETIQSKCPTLDIPTPATVKLLRSKSNPPNHESQIHQPWTSHKSLNFIHTNHS